MPCATYHRVDGADAGESRPVRYSRLRAPVHPTKRPGGGNHPASNHV